MSKPTNNTQNMHIDIHLPLLHNAFLNLQKNRSLKLSMLEKKNKDSFEIYFFDKGRFSNKNYIYFFLVQKKPEIKKNKNRKSGFEVSSGIRCRYQNCPCFSSSIDGF